MALREFSSKSAGRQAVSAFLVIFVGLLMSTILGAQSLDDPRVPFTGGKNADLWVLAGQSNMLGCALHKGPTEPDPRIMEFTRDKKWVIAQEPLHEDREGVDTRPDTAFPIRQHILMQRYGEVFPDNLTPEVFLERLGKPKGGLEGVGPGLFFAKHLIKYTNRPIGLIFCPFGGTTMAMWDPSLKGPDDLYPFMMRQIRAVGAPIKGMLWYQGEGDTGPTSAVYEKAFLSFIDAFRRDVGNPDLPFIYVQIGRWPWPGSDAELNSGSNLVREVQRRIFSQRKNVFFTSAIDLPMDDFIHIAYEGQERLGRRLAEVALSEVYSKPGHGRPIDIASIEMLHPTCDRSIIRVRFSGVSGRLTSKDRPTGFKLIPSDPSANRVLYRVDFDATDAAAVLLGIYTAFRPQDHDQIMYAPGRDPYVNIVDESDMPVPAFGPLDLPSPKAVPCSPM
jgi:sialate O-acetylesterase